MSGSLTPAVPALPHNERELKLALADDADLPDLDGLMDGITTGRSERRQVRDTYHDTADLRLARWGVTLRWRRGTGWVVKLPRPSVGAVLDRDEITLEGRPGQPPEEAVALVASFTRGQPLVPVAELATRRTARQLLDADGVPVAEVVEDRVTARTDTNEVSFRELEVELLPGGDPSLLVALQSALAEHAGVDPLARPKLVRALGLAAMAPPDVVVPPLGPAPTGAEVVRAAIATSVVRVVNHLPGVRLGLDPEGVHQARVATRRLRSDLRTFGPLLDQEWASQLREELSWLADELGRVRDADVLGGILRAVADAHPEIDPAGVSGLLDLLDRQRDADRTTLLGHLDDARTTALLDRLVDAAASPRTGPEAAAPAAEILPPLVRRSWRRLHRSIKALQPDSPIDDLHRVRILAKRVRYASEAVAPACGPDAVAFGRGAAAIQDSLGALNDAAVAGAWLAATARRSRGRTAFAAGQLAQQLDIDARSHRTGWIKPYRRMQRKRAWLAV